jgi:nucleoside-diphosphate-sugar epimerase
MKSHKSAIVCGAGGFIGSHLVKRLKKEGYYVIGIDLKKPEFSKSLADKFIVGDLRDQKFVKKNIVKVDEIYQLAADMGGAGYLFTGDSDANIMHNSVMINLNILDQASKIGVNKIFYSSSACVYPISRQESTKGLSLTENIAYPANPDSEYGWEKLFSERLYLAYARNTKIKVRIARFHNIFGPEGTWRGGKEKVPAAMCRKIAETKDGGTIEIWGDGKQTRSFLFVEECVEGIRRLMKHKSFTGPVNIGSEEMVSINDLAQIIMNIAGKKLKIKHIKGPLGVRARTSNNKLIKKMLYWEPNKKLRDGLEKTYPWIKYQVDKSI